MTRAFATLTALAVLCVAVPAQATQTNYQVQGPTPASYAPLTGGTPVLLTPSGDEGMGTVQIPSSFNFRFYGQAVSTAYVSSNGFITFSSTVASQCTTGFSCYFSAQ